MANRILSGVRVAILVADGFEQVELTRPRRRLVEHGAEVEIVSLRSGSIRGMNLLVPGKKVKVDRTVFSADPDDYDALLIPGGFVSPDLLRQSARVLEFVRAFDRARKPIAAICHGPWVLISAGLVRGRRLTSWRGIQDDVRNAGGIWEDMAVVKDRNLITSRDPGDLVHFHQAMIEHFGPGVIAHERRGALPYGWLVGGLATVALGLAARWLTRERWGGSWLPEWLEGARHPGEASLEAYEQMLRQDIPHIAAAQVSRAGRVSVVPTSSP